MSPRKDLTGPKPASPRVRVRRLPDRGRYAPEEIHAILDEAYICHVGFTDPALQQPIVTPTACWRHGNRLYIHGSSKSRTTMALAQGIPACVTVTLLDGLVMARSGFHHSMNYRSVIALGRFEAVTDPAYKLQALEHFLERIQPGRWAETRPPNKQELKATLVLAMDLTEASAKCRFGPPKDDEEDMALGCWAGVVPFETRFGKPIDDPLLKPGLAPSPYYSRRRK